MDPAVDARWSGRALAVLATCVAISGCGASEGSSGGSSTSSGEGTAAAKLAQAQATHEYPSPAPQSQTAVGGAPGAVQAILAFASQYINWTAGTVAGQMQALAAESIGQARSAMALAAAQTAQDYELQRGGIANSGTVEAIAPLRGHARQFVVVTRELTTATNSSAYQGLLPGWHIALATVVQLRPGQWVLSNWQPES